LFYSTAQPELTLFRLGFLGLLRTGGDFCSNHPITLKFYMHIMYDKIFTHAKIWSNDVIFDDDVSILSFDVLIGLANIL